MWGYTVFTLYNKGKFCVGVHSFLPLYKGTFCVGVHSFSPLYKGCNNCVSHNPGTVFSLNIRDELPNSVNLFEPSENSLGTVVILSLIYICYLWLTFSGLKQLILDQTRKNGYQKIPFSISIHNLMFVFTLEWVLWKEPWYGCDFITFMYRFLYS